MKERLTIYDIKYRLLDAPYFFSRTTMKFFHQTLKDFKVYKLNETTYKITAPMKDWNGNIVGETERIFNTLTNKFE